MIGVPPKSNAISPASAKFTGILVNRFGSDGVVVDEDVLVLACWVGAYVLVLSSCLGDMVYTPFSMR